MSVDLADRYGTKSGRRPLRISMIALVIIVPLGWLAWASMPYFNPEVTSQLNGFEIVSSHEATVRGQVEISDDAEDVTCRVKALASDKSVVGELTFVPVEGTNEQVITTEREASSVDWIGCKSEGQPRPQ